MLGPSVMVTSMPLGLIYAGRAIGRSPDRQFAWGGFVIALIFTTIMSIGLLMMVLSPT